MEPAGIEADDEVANRLEGELAFGSWFVLEAEAGDVLTDDPECLWERVLARQEGLLGRVADYPEDPSMN